MRYTKPNILTTVPATAAIQTGANGERKIFHVYPDHSSMLEVRSTSGAYEADE